MARVLTLVHKLFAQECRGGRDDTDESCSSKDRKVADGMPLLCCFGMSLPLCWFMALINGMIWYNSVTRYLWICNLV